MHRLLSFVLSGIMLVAAAATVAAADPPAAARPNVLFIFADDQRADTIHALGNAAIRTPHLDRLARRGLAFDRAHMQGGMHGATCVPSRAMLLSGRNLFRIDEKLVRDVTWPEAFGRAGYSTFVSGKWHNGDASLVKCFQTARSMFTGGMTNPLDAKLRTVADGKVGPPVLAPKHACEVFTDETIRFLQDHAKRGPEAGPFFAYLPFDGPHDPHIVPDDFPIRYEPSSIPLPANFLPQHPWDNGEMTVRDEQLLPWPRTADAVRQMLADYYRYVSYLDAQIGRVLDVLDASPFAKTTIVVFAADSGVARGSHGLIGKQNLYEHSVRVPLIVAGPGVAAGKRTDALCYLFDVLPTLGKRCGVEAPGPSDGFDLNPTLEEPSRPARQSLLFAYRDVQRAIRDGRWKLIRYPQIDRQQLFDLDVDPDETTDLAAKPEHAARVAALRELLAREMEASGDRAKLDVANPKPADWTPPAPKPKAVEHRVRTIEGWQVRIHPRLLDEQNAATEKALELLAQQLREIVRVVPAPAVAELRKVPLWFSPEYPKVPPRAEYHPGAGWLRDNGRDPAMEKAVEFTDVKDFERETKRMPNFTLHELAHAYHDRVLPGGFGNEDLKRAFENAKSKGLYDKVEQRFGDGRSRETKAYALTSPMEYFAECSEAFFSTNDFFPFSREQLAKHDPDMFALLKKLWGEPASAAKPVRVYVLAGQSNMEGHGFVAADPKRNGGKGSLEFVVKDAATAPRFAHLVDADGRWRTRDDVFLAYLERRGPLTVGYGARPELIGPELGFGWVVGDAYDEPILLVKCAWGGKSLAVDFRPPSAGRPAYSLGEKMDAAIEQDPQILGKYYRETVTLTKAALGDVRRLVPGSDGRYVLAGFGWHQGWNDRINDKFNAEYESNMSHFIRDFRRDLEAPNLPFVIAETGMNGPEEKHPRALSLMKAQAAVAQREEFRGNVAFVGTKEFWRPQEASPSGQGYHWNTNAETYYLIGDAMGRAMKHLH